MGRDSVGANPGVFLARGGDGRPLSFAEVHAAFGNVVEEQRTARAGLPGGPAAPSAARTSHRAVHRVEVAEAR